MSRLTTTVVLVLGLCWQASPARAEVKPHGLFTEGMVLQQGTKALPVWGTADPGEKVTVSIQGQEVSATAAKDGNWVAHLNALKAGGPFEMTIAGTNRIVFKNVLVGEVWVCSGQSNMEWSLSRTRDPKEVIASSADPQLRLFTVQRVPAKVPQRELPVAKGGQLSTWQECGPQSVGNFSAVAYYFGRDLRKALKVPVGVIHSSVGGTAAERWTSRATLDRYPELKGLGGTDLYNGMIAPLIPYAIKGVTWYQGESNAGRAAQYKVLFPAMIRNWRDDWKRGDFPFLFVQLAPYDRVKVPGQWAELRETQLYTALNVPNTAMAVITDAGHPTDIHPPDKAPVGARLALAARAVAYGEKIVHSGPIYSGLDVRDDKAIVRFRHVGSGLASKGGDLQGFEIAGADGKFVKASAVIQGETVIVSSPAVARPATVRFGWANYPTVNLFNREGLPASPFRSNGPTAAPEKGAR
ncbi:MAG: sialate O-acetylesterase [Gemmataceae bacterium]|nr:sialate O-acetylesterase [Gemmataceae bacterium]